MSSASYTVKCSFFGQPSGAVRGALTSINLYGNALGPEGAKALAPAISVSGSLTNNNVLKHDMDVATAGGSQTDPYRRMVPEWGVGGKPRGHQHHASGGPTVPWATYAATDVSG